MALLLVSFRHPLSDHASVMVVLTEMFLSEDGLETIFLRGNCPAAQGEGLFRVILRDIPLLPNLLLYLGTKCAEVTLLPLGMPCASFRRLRLMARW